MSLQSSSFLTPEQIDAAKHPVFLKPKSIKKAWGYEEIIDRSEDYCAKFLVYTRNGAESSFHAHPCKRETWLVVDGTFRLTCLSNEGYELYTEITPGSIVRLNPLVFHQLKCLSDFGKIYEVSTRDVSSDIIRICPGDDQKKVQS